MVIFVDISTSRLCKKNCDAVMSLTVKMKFADVY